MRNNKFTANGIIALSLLALGWLLIWLASSTIATVGGMVVLTAIAVIMVFLTR